VVHPAPCAIGVRAGASAAFANLRVREGHDEQMHIAMTTSGGDAPGLNAVIKGATTAAITRGHTISGLERGFQRLMKEDVLVPLTRDRVDGIERTGGTILGAASDGNPFSGSNGADLLIEKFEKHGIDALIIAGGDGSMGIAKMLSDQGVRVVGVPKTIDRDVSCTWTTFGFDSAVNTATEALDRLHTTTASHDRLMVIEVMGRDAGWIALYAGIGGGAHMIALPEVPYYLDVYARHIAQREQNGARYHMLVASEGARPAGGDTEVSDRTGRYGGIGERLAADLHEATGKEARSIALGHLLRGGAPTTFDRVLGVRFGSAAVSALHRGEAGVMVSFQPPAMVTVPLTEVVGRRHLVSVHTHELQTALNMGISFGN
jgi:ATP-dependent phosphofructokinase / diphosphate-dependent phosphofructokinase